MLRKINGFIIYLKLCCEVSKYFFYLFTQLSFPLPLSPPPSNSLNLLTTRNTEQHLQYCGHKKELVTSIHKMGNIITEILKDYDTGCLNKHGD